MLLTFPTSSRRDGDPTGSPCKEEGEGVRPARTVLRPESLAQGESAVPAGKPELNRLGSCSGFSTEIVRSYEAIGLPPPPARSARLAADDGRAPTSITQLGCVAGADGARCLDVAPHAERSLMLPGQGAVDIKI